jgi:hypothetical protein
MKAKFQGSDARRKERFPIGSLWISVSSVYYVSFCLMILERKENYVNVISDKGIVGPIEMSSLEIYYAKINLAVTEEII